MLQNKQINNIKNRLLILSPTVQEGLERESNKDDFEALDDKALGKGGFGHVWKVRHKITQKIYAIKVINKDYIIKEKMVDQISREIEIMYRTDHPHIIKLYNHYEDDNNFYLIMHCASKGQLYSQLKKLKRLDEKVAAQYLREVISAVKYLHSMKPPIIHRDIKPENILLDSDGRAKLADFGWSNFYEENKQRETYCGTPEYLAPEMVNKSGHNEGVDIWSLGVLMFELLSGRPPFIYKGDASSLYEDIKALKIRWTDDFPILAKDLVGKILKLKSSQRLSLDEIIEHPWFKETPALRPELKIEKYDPAAKLRSHLIHILPEQEDQINNKIKEMISAKRESLRNEKTQNKNNTESTYNDQEQKFTKDEIFSLKEEIVKKDKIIEEFKSKIEKILSDETTLKIRDQERNSFLIEIEAKSKLLLEVESELSNLKAEFNQLERKYRQTKDLLDETIEKNKDLDNLNNELVLKINKLDQERQQDAINFDKKLRLAEINFIERDSKSSSNESDLEKIYTMTNDYLIELKDLMKNKFYSVCEKIIENEKLVSESKTSIIDTIDRKSQTMLSKMQAAFEKSIQEEKNLLQKQIEEISNSNANFSKILEWYKKQINELFPYKQKYQNFEESLKSITAEKDRILEQKNILEEKNTILESYVKSFSEQKLSIESSKEKYKTAFLESERLFKKYVPEKKLRDLINFRDFDE